MVNRGGILAWDYYFLFLSFGFLFALMLIPKDNPLYLIITFILFGICILVLMYIREHVIRTKTEKIASVPFLDGRISTGKSGEDYLIGVRRHYDLPELTNKERKNIDKFIEEMFEAHERLTKFGGESTEGRRKKKKV